MLQQRDIRKDFYNKLELKTKYFSLQDKIKDYLFYTDFLKQNRDTGRRVWQYEENTNPLKTKDYLSAQASVKFAGILDIHDRTYFKDKFMNKVMKKKIKVYTQKSKGNSVGKLKRRAKLKKNRAVSAKQKQKFLKQKIEQL